MKSEQNMQSEVHSPSTSGIQERPRRRRNPQATRARIFEAAERLFSERGYSGVTIGDIADAAHVNRRMVYVYFGDKTQVYTEVMNQIFDKIWKPVVEVLSDIDEPTPPIEVYDRVVTTYFDALQRNPRYLRLLTWEAATGWETLNSIDSPILNDVTSRGVRLLQRGQQQGLITSELDPRILQSIVTTLPFFYFVYAPRMKNLLPDSGNISDEDAKASILQMARRLLADQVR